MCSSYRGIDVASLDIYGNDAEEHSMLKDFLYLNAKSLDQYVSQIEDGLRGSRNSTKSQSKDKDGKLGATWGGVTGSLGKASNNSLEEQVESLDTGSAKFKRILDAVEGNEDLFSWVDVLDPKNEMSKLSAGEFVTVDADVAISSISQALSGTNGLASKLDDLKRMLSTVQAINLTKTNTFNSKPMPNIEEVEALGQMAQALQSNPWFVGELDDTDWKILGQLDPEFIQNDFEGLAKIVAKVSQIVPKGQKRPLFTVPMSNMFSKKQKEEFYARPIEPGSEEAWVQGPLVMVNVLAVYR